MPSRIEDYALIGDCQTAGLVGKDGSLDWLCFPRFDSPACFAALLGTPEHGRWRIAPAGEVRSVRRRYRDGTLILETEFETDDGAVTLIDFMPIRTAAPDVVRIVEGKRGRVPMRLELVIRFDYGSIVPWVRHQPGGIRAIAGPDTLYCRGDAELRGEDLHTVADFAAHGGRLRRRRGRTQEIRPHLDPHSRGGAAAPRLHGTAALSRDQATTELAASPEKASEDAPSATAEPAEANEAAEAAEAAQAPAAALSPSQRRGELRRLLRRFLVVCETVHYAHSRGVIHRDLKPSNIMLGRHGETLVVDWGLAKTLEHAEFQVDDSAGDHGPLAVAGDGSDATLAGRVIGTPGFMAPEQAEGDTDHLTLATHIYSLGATLYCLLTGRPPFQAATAAESIEQIRRGEFPRPRAVNPAVSPALEAVCLKAMATQPRDRYASAKELAEELDRWLADEPVLAWREPLWRRGARWMRRHRSWTAAAAAALVLITIVSAASAVWVGAARRSETGALEREAAQREVAERLAAAMVVKDVESLRRDRPPGWTWTSMKQLSQAMRMAPEQLDLPQVRTLAAACLTSVDARSTGEYGRRQPSHCVAFSPDGRFLADAASKAGWTPATVTLVNLADGTQQWLNYARGAAWELRTAGKTDGGRALAFSPDGRWLVVGTRSGWIHRWDLRQIDQEPAEWKPQEGDVEVHELLFSRDGASLYAVSRSLDENGEFAESTVTRWTTGDWASEPAAAASLPGQVHLALTEDEKLLFATGPETCWLDARTLAVRRKVEGGALTEAASAPEAGLLAGARSGTAHVLDSSGRVVVELRDERLAAGHAGAIRNLSFDPTGRLLISGANEDGVKIWDLLDSSLAVRLPLPGSETTWPAFSADGRRLASPAGDVTALFEVRSGNALEIAALQAGEVTAFAWSPSGEHLLSLAREGDSQHVSRWSGGARTKLGALAVPPGAASPLLAIHPAGEAVCVLPGHDVYRIAAGPEDAELSPLKVEGVSDVRLAAFSPAGSRLWLVEGTERVSLWDVPQDGLARGLKPAGEYTTRGMDILVGRGNILCLAAAGEKAFVGLDNGLVMAMDAASSGPSGMWSTHTTRVEAIAAGGDGELIAAGTDGGAVVVFRPDHEGIETRFAPFTRRGVASLAFDARGELLAVGSSTGEVQLWRRGPQGFERLATLREADGRAASLRFHPARPRLAAHIAGERGVRMWRLDVLNEALQGIGAAW